MNEVLVLHPEAPTTLPIELFPGVTVDMATAFHATAAALVVLFMAGIVMFRVRKVPGRMQTTAELLVSGLNWAITGMSGARSAHRYLPVIGTALLFLLSYHLQGALRVDAFTMGQFPQSGLEIGGEPIRVDLDGNGVADSGDSFNDRNRNGHHDRGLIIPHPSMAVWNVQVDLAVGMILIAVVLNEAFRRRRLLQLLIGLLTLQWVGILRDFVVAFSKRCNIRPIQFIAVATLMILLTIVGAANRMILAKFGLDIPLALIAGITCSLAITLPAIALLGCSTGEGRWASPVQLSPESEDMVTET